MISAATGLCVSADLAIPSARHVFLLDHNLYLRRHWQTPSSCLSVGTLTVMAAKEFSPLLIQEVLLPAGGNDADIAVQARRWTLSSL